MPGIDWIPGVSHLKAAVQAITGDTEGAGRTMENFHRECPGVSQVHSLVQFAVGDVEGAIETQKRCLSTANNVANGIPLVGHVKGVVHHAVGDHEGGNQALNAATRSLVVVASGAAAAITTGGIAAIPAGIAAGVCYDVSATQITGIEQGSVAVITNAIDNPSAAAIFDAVAIPIGDGLAGYSGGQVTSKLSSTQIKLNPLEVAKAANPDQLNVAFNQGAGGALGRSAMNSDQQNTLRNANGINVLLIESDAGLEDALDYDSYVDATVTKDNKQEKLRKLKQHDEERPTRNIPQVHRPELIRRINQDPNRDPSNNSAGTVESTLTDLIMPSWIPLDMPQEFDYTTVVQVNSDSQGLQHSFIRHMAEWEEFISLDTTLMNRLSPVMSEINRLGSVSETTAREARNQSQKAREALRNALRKLSYGDCLDVRKALVEIQMMLYLFIQENLTFDNYIGRTVNSEGHVQLHFEVKTKTGETKVMVVCVSDEIFYPYSSNNDRRPIRTVVTVFFKPWRNDYSGTLAETKEGIQNKRT